MSDEPDDIGEQGPFDAAVDILRSMKRWPPDFRMDVVEILHAAVVADYQAWARSTSQSVPMSEADAASAAPQTAAQPDPYVPMPLQEALEGDLRGKLLAEIQSHPKGIAAGSLGNILGVQTGGEFRSFLRELDEQGLIKTAAVGTGLRVYPMRQANAPSE